MRIRARLLPLAVAAVMLGASVSPCALGVGTAGSAQLRAAAAAAAQPPDCHRAATPELAAPCPCGCSDDGAASLGSRLALGPLPMRTVLSIAPPARPAPGSAARPADAPPFRIDHVPLLG